MTKGQVLRETLSRLYAARSCKPEGGNKTREEDWLESIVRILINFSADDPVEIPVTLELLQHYNVFIKLMDMIEDQENGKM